MKKLGCWLFISVLALAGCSKQENATQPASSAAQTAPSASTTAPPAEAQPTQAPEAASTTPPGEQISETSESIDEAPPSNVQPSLKLGAAPSGPATSSQFREGANYQKVVPAQPTSVAPGKIEVLEVFWYGCPHCFALEPALESWRNNAKAPYVEFVRVPAMWGDVHRMHARIFYTAEALGKLDELHSLIFREIHVNGNQLNSVDKIAAFFAQHGVSKEEFNKAFSSFAVENKLQRADFLNRRYRIEAVPSFVVNGKYKTSLSDAGDEPRLFALLNELAAHEHGG